MDFKTNCVSHAFDEGPERSRQVSCAGKRSCLIFQVCPEASDRRTNAVRERVTTVSACSLQPSLCVTVSKGEGWTSLCDTKRKVCFSWARISINFRFLTTSTHTHIHTHTCTNKHAHTHTYAHAHKQTHTHTLTFVLSTVYTRHLKQWLYCILLHSQQYFCLFQQLVIVVHSFTVDFYYIYIFMTERPRSKFWISYMYNTV